MHKTTTYIMFNIYHRKTKSAIYTHVGVSTPREDYWIKTLQTAYPYGLNEKTQFMNKELPVEKLFPPVRQYGEHFIETRTRSKTSNQDL